ncbi:MazG nucleotide pyrophosphohydrolase domain-containing protein [Lysinibacillus sphaericus]|uniref:MazG nucleotide pyrophosphohydrolase domain-containing protein n=1 Tax=Lysinibacillus sphaericus TaxID=1421 RepID=UPI001C5D19EA
MDISSMQKYVKQFSEEKGFHVNTIHTRTLYLVTEVGELSKEILSISFNPTEEKVRLAKENIGLEMYDVLFNVLDLANRLEIELEDACRKKMEMNKDRIWYER